MSYNDVALVLLNSVLPNGWTSTIHDTIIDVEEHKKLKTVLFLKWLTLIVDVHPLLQWKLYHEW